MFDFDRMRAFLVVAFVAAAAEGAVIYHQWPSAATKYCASTELAGLVAAALNAEAELRAARSRLQAMPQEEATKEVMRYEAASAAASNELARYKQRQSQAGGDAAREGPCS